MRRFGTTGLALSLALVGAACNDSSGEDGSPNDDGINDGGDDDDDDDAGTGAATTTGTPPTGGGTTMGVADGGTTSSADDNGDEDPPPPIKLDLGTVPDAPSEDTACRKVDFLFVIDNSGSMFSYQQELVANFPVFIDGIQSSLDSVMSYQVGVVTTDTYNFNAPGCTGLSSLVVQTGGFDSSMMTCGPYAEGFNFMTQEDDLASEFSCAAQVGTQGDGFERTMAAVEAAVQREEGNPGQCNEGFIRDDALLVIVIITDEADGPGDPDGGPPVASSPGDPDSWYDTVVDAKFGLPENVVVLSLINYVGGPCPPASNTANGQNIADFTLLFEDNGFLGGICEIDYGPIFEEAIGVIDEACDNFTPPG